MQHFFKVGCLIIKNQRMNQETFQHTVFILKDEMYRFAKRLLANAEEAEDLTQDLMLKFWQKRDELDHINVKAYAMRAVRNECLNMIRHEQVKRKIIRMNPINTATTQHTDRDLKDIIVRYIQALPDKQRDTIYFKDVEGYEIKEIADIMNITESSVRANLMRARQKIKEQIKLLMDYENRQISRQV